MSEIFLSRVELKDFRTYGELALDIPPGPGLTLLVGTNGLGKSSFFDAIEWCLTDQVRRFSKHIGRLKEADYLTRRDAPRDSHSVSLQFTQGRPIVRSAAIRPDETTLVDLLKTSGWGEIRDLGIYLAFTHFLGQAAQQRFTSRLHTEQWEALKGPSGIDRLEAIRTNLRGRATGNAFRKRIEDQQLRIGQAETALLAWREASDRLLRLQHAAAAAGAMPPDAFEAGWMRVAVELAGLTAEVALPTESEDTGERLAALRHAFDGEAARTSEAVAGMERARVMLDRYLSLASQSDLTDAAGAAAKAQIAGATTALSTEILASGKAERAVAEQAALSARINEAVDQLAKLRALVDEKARMTPERQMLTKEIAQLESRRASQDSAIASARPILVKAIEDQSRRASLTAQRSVLQSLVARASEIASLESDLALKEQLLGAGESGAEAAKDTVAVLQTELAGMEVKITEGELKLIALRRKASDMADALTRIATHLGEHDQSCPVCSSSFRPGVLKSLAGLAAKSENADLVEQARINETLIDDRATKRRQLMDAEAVIVAGQMRLKETVAARVRLADTRSAVATALDVPDSADLGRLAQERLADVDAALAPLVAAETAGALPVEETRVAITASEAELAAVRRQLDVAREQLARREAVIQRIDEQLATFVSAVPTVEEIADRIDAQQKLAAAARDRQVELEAQHAVAVAAEVSVRQRLFALQGEYEKRVESAHAARRAMEETARQWTREGLPGVPDRETFDLRTTELAARSARLKVLRDSLSALSHAHEAITAQNELQIVVRNMEEHGGLGSASNPSEHERQLQQTLSDARDALRLTESAKAAVNAYAGQLQAEADNFSAKFLKPLNDLIDGFNRALLSTPGETVQFSTDFAVDRPQLGMQLRYADEIDNALYNTELHPQLVLSEGQMAANGFSILCAASVAYPWSNWRALLLDDPLQHNDVIHAAAFVDVMRNLVELKGYQLIMSSHDRAESDFLARKFDAAGLPCTVLALTAPSKEGLRFEPPRYNRAAREMMNVVRAQTA